MNIEFNKISIYNFMSIGSSEIKLKDNGYTLVTGTNNSNDGAISNGSGKSSIFEAIIWCLCGETLRGSKNVVNINGDDGALVVLEFSFDDKVYTVLRSKEHSKYKTTLQITVDGKDISGKGIRDSEKILRELLPDLTSSFIGSVIILGQGMPLKFSNNTPSGRKEVLEKLSKSDFMIEDLKKRLVERKLVVHNLLRQAEDETLTASTKIETNQDLLSECKKDLEKLNALDINKQKIHLSELKDECKLVCEEIVKKEDEIKGLDFESSINSFEDEKNNCLKTYTTKKEELDNKRYKEREDILDGFVTQKSELSELKQYVQNVEKMVDFCPTCGQKLHNVVKPDVTNEKNRILELTTKLNVCDESINDIENVYKIACKTIEDEYNQSILRIKESLSNLTVAKNSLDNELKILNTKRNDINNEINKITVELDNFENENNKLITYVKKYEEQINTYTNEYEKSSELTENYRRRESILNKFDSVIKRDFRGYLLSNIIKYIDERANVYSQDIFGDSLIEFKLEGNNIIIKFQQKDYENLSGGEKQKVDLIVQFALRDMLSTYMNFSSSLLVLDEIFDNLDYLGCERVINMISKRFNDVSSIYIISHHANELNIPVDNCISVIKESNGVSHII